MYKNQVFVHHTITKKNTELSSTVCSPESLGNSSLSLQVQIFYKLTLSRIMSISEYFIPLTSTGVSLEQKPEEKWQRARIGQGPQAITHIWFLLWVQFNMAVLWQMLQLRSTVRALISHPEVSKRKIIVGQGLHWLTITKAAINWQRLILALVCQSVYCMHVYVCV